MMMTTPRLAGSALRAKPAQVLPSADLRRAAAVVTAAHQVRLVPMAGHAKRAIAWHRMMATNRASVRPLNRDGLIAATAPVRTSLRPLSLAAPQTVAFASRILTAPYLTQPRLSADGYFAIQTMHLR